MLEFTYNATIWIMCSTVLCTVPPCVVNDQTFYLTKASLKWSVYSRSISVINKVYTHNALFLSVYTNIAIFNCNCNLVLVLVLLLPCTCSWHHDGCTLVLFESQSKLSKFSGDPPTDPQTHGPTKSRMEAGNFEDHIKQNKLLWMVRNNLNRKDLKRRNREEEYEFQ